MFDSLKSKLKSVFSKSEKLDSKEIYEPESELPVEAAPKPAEEAFPSDEELTISEPVSPIRSPLFGKKPTSEPAPAEKKPAEEVPEKKVSRKEALRQSKQNKPDRPNRFSTDGMVGASGKKIKEDPLDDLLDELEVALLESDVAYPVVQEIIVGVRDNLVNKKYAREYTLEQVVEHAVKSAVREVLKVNEFDFAEWLEGQPRPTVVMFIGINGTGKTTVIAKMSKLLTNEGKSVVLAACDTFRAGAIEQLSIHAERLGVKIVKQTQDADPASVAYDAIEHAKSKKRDIVLIDTAGRMQTNNNLIDEMKKISRVSKPALKIFVGDALAGNDAIEQAKAFDAAVGIDAIILTKIDTDAKGGAALSIAHTIGKPIAFVCDGQEYEDIQKFDADWMLDRLFE
ncbi:MAG: signal recognition particle-docking protein FtsY [Candidatus Methanoplasma sp.]|jgi:fused signal recognition particle receptor|nr:signal recognition particle-docking protein FtsY [Candidatus Methanoplasma sp.]